MCQRKNRPKMRWLGIMGSRRALMRATESVKQTCPVIEPGGWRIRSIKMRANRSLREGTYALKQLDERYQGV